MLRRIKSEIVELKLPPRIVKVEECEFDESEQFMYEQLAAAAERQIDLISSVRKTACCIAYLLSHIRQNL
jgi:SNF2 family DNA or RNA helicase